MPPPPRAAAPHPLVRDADRINVGRNERLASILGGALLTVYGISRVSFGGLLTATAGGALLVRGVTGHCPLFHTLGHSTAGDGVVPTADPSGATVAKARGTAPQPVEIREAMTIMRPRGEVYAVWRNYERLATIMTHVERIQQIDERHTTWTVRAPKGAGTFAYEAETIHEEPGERITWRSTPGSDIHNAGEVVFRDGPQGAGTEVIVALTYRPPGADAGRALASLLNPAFSQMVKEDIRRFKQVLEAGEIPTIEGQPTGA